MTNYIILFFMLLFFVVYCIYLLKTHKKSPFFIVGIVWFALNIMCSIVTILKYAFVDYIAPANLQTYMIIVSIVVASIRVLRCCSVISMAVCFYFSQKKKSENIIVKRDS